MPNPTPCDFHATWTSASCDPDPVVCVTCTGTETAAQCAKRFAAEVKALLLECPADQNSLTLSGSSLPDLFLTL